MKQKIIITNKKKVFILKDKKKVTIPKNLFIIFNIWSTKIQVFMSPD